MPGAEEPPDRIEGLASGRTQELAEWRWLWEGDHAFPIRSHRRGGLGRLVVFAKLLLRPAVKASLADLWDRQRRFNLILLSHLEELYKLRQGLHDLGQDLQRVQREILEDVRAIQSDYIRDVGDLNSRVEHLEDFLRQGFREVMQHHDALFSRLDQKLDRMRRETAGE